MPSLGKNFREQAFVHLAVDDMDARHAGFTRLRRCCAFDKISGAEICAVQLQTAIFQFGHEHLPDEQAVVNQSVAGRDEN